MSQPLPQRPSFAQKMREAIGPKIKYLWLHPWRSGVIAGLLGLLGLLGGNLILGSDAFATLQAWKPIDKLLAMLVWLLTATIPTPGWAIGILVASLIALLAKLKGHKRPALAAEFADREADLAKQLETARKEILKLKQPPQLTASQPSPLQVEALEALTNGRVTAEDIAEALFKRTAVAEMLLHQLNSCAPRLVVPTGHNSTQNRMIWKIEPYGTACLLELGKV